MQKYGICINYQVVFICFQPGYAQFKDLLEVPPPARIAKHIVPHAGHDIVLVEKKYIQAPAKRGQTRPCHNGNARDFRTGSQALNAIWQDRGVLLMQRNIGIHGRFGPDLQVSQVTFG